MIKVSLLLQYLKDLEEDPIIFIKSFVENVYTKKECLDKTTGPDGEFDYHSYVDQTCFEFCSDICGGGYPSDCQNPDVRSCVEY